MSYVSSFLPWKVRAAVMDALRVPQRLSAWWRRRAVVLCPAKDEIVLHFGFAANDLGFVHGGRVKLTHLASAFPVNEKQFNILYLVSSALPPFAEDTVRWAKKHGAKLVWNQNGVAYPAWAGAEAERYNRPMRRLRAMADFVIYQSEFCKKSADKFLGPNDAPSRVLLNPVNLDKFHPKQNILPVPPSPHPPILPPSSLRLLAAGTHGYRERVTVAIDCLNVLHQKGIDATLTIAGKMEWPSADVEIHDYLKKHRLISRVHLVSRFSQEEAVALFQDHDILLHPKYMDPCPTIVAEALACGLPIVASRSGGVPEMVSNSCSRLIAVPKLWETMSTPSGQELAAAVEELMPVLDQAKISARKHAEEIFDVGQWLEQHRGIFSQLICNTRCQ